MIDYSGGLTDGTDRTDGRYGTNGTDRRDGTHSIDRIYVTDRTILYSHLNLTPNDTFVGLLLSQFLRCLTNVNL